MSSTATDADALSKLITAVFILLPLIGYYFYNEPFGFVVLVYLAIIAYGVTDL